MESTEIDVSRAGPVRLLSAVALGAVAIASLRKRKRLLALLSGAGAVALGYAATTGDTSAEQAPRASSIEPTGEREGMRCAACGEPIVVGQGRQPNDDDDTVHDACLE
jgi:uncharacterized membrane protein